MIKFSKVFFIFSILIIALFASCATAPETAETAEEETEAAEAGPFGTLENWEANMTAKLEAVSGGIHLDNGVASYIEQQYGNEILQFDMSMDIVAWPAFALRQGLPGQPYWNGTDCFLVVFGAGEDTVELHRQNKNEIIQSVDNTFFESGETHTITAGAINEEGGVRVKVFIDDNEVLNHLEENPIVGDQGYFTVYAWGTDNPITVTNFSVVESYPGE
jgi:hypothetical protein